jgi:acylphosphatase
VGFRYTVARIAQRHRVTGYVMNKADGSVEVVAEGQRAAVSGFLQDIEGSHLGGYVRDRGLDWSAARNEYGGFSIEHGW